LKKIKYKKYIIAKAKNNDSIRVIYKKAGQAPEVKIINNIFKLKKLIIERNLEIIPYENLFIICNNKKLIKNKIRNIFLTFRSIYGDLILVKIDPKEREFKSLSQEDIIFFSKDLINKSPINNQNNINKKNTRKITEYYERGFEENRYNKSNNFENTLINVLNNLELILTNILKK